MILECGVKAPSARNKQPWRFTVVRDISLMKESLAIPEGYRAVSVLRIRNLDRSVDAVSSASPRNPLNEVVNYK